MLQPKGEGLQPTRTVRRLEAATATRLELTPGQALLRLQEHIPDLQQKVQPPHVWLHQTGVQAQDILHRGPPPLITVPTGRAPLITAVPAEAVPQELTAHLQHLPNRVVHTKELHPQEVAAAAVTAAVAHPLQGVMRRAVWAAPEAAGHPLHHHQEEEGKPDVSHNFKY